MDVNGTHFQLLLGYEDWGNCSASADGQSRLRTFWEQPSSQDGASGTAWSRAAFELTLQPYTMLIADTPLQARRSPGERRGADRDRNGNWYWIDDTGTTVLCMPGVNSASLPLWSARDGIAYGMQAGMNNLYARVETALRTDTVALSGLVVTDEQYLLVGTLQPAGLLIFDLLAGGLPRQIFWPTQVPFAPFDMAAMPGGGAWILDRVNARYWALGRSFTLIQQDQQELLLTAERADIFQQVEGSATRTMPSHTFPAGISLQALSSIVPGMPLAIEALPDGTVLILVSNPTESFSLIYRYAFGKQLGTPVSTEAARTLIEQDRQAQFDLNGHDFAFVPTYRDAANNTIPDRLYIVPRQNNQVYAFDIWQEQDQLALQPLPLYLPLRFFSGRRLVTVEHQVYYDFSTTWLPLVELQRPRHNPCATFYTPLGEPRHAFDGKMPGCVWHRLLLDAYIPPETNVSIWSRTADNEQELPTMHWDAEPALYLRNDGSELPFVTQAGGEGNGTWELLLQAARGRFLQLKIVLTGNGRVTPHLRAMRIYYPRFSYLEQYLPAVYREDGPSASFLDRFLANIEGFYSAIEGRIAAVQMLFDPRSVPQEALPWLASWLGITLNASWNSRKQRFFVKHAIEIYRYRGTLNGLLILLHLAFDARPNGPEESTLAEYLANRTHQATIRIVERFRTRYVPAAVLGDATDAADSYFAERWQPAQGGAALLLSYRNFLRQQKLASTQITAFPIVAPSEQPLYIAWHDFVKDTLGFVPRAVEFIRSNAQVWQQFLERRYEDIAALDRDYQGIYNDFAEVTLAETLPADGPELWDWYQFETVVIPTRLTAHQFTVLLPLPEEEAPLTQYRHLELARRIIEREKPAHTQFEVKYYQAVFRLGTARLGIDTFIDSESHTRQVLRPMILGQGHLADAYLAQREPEDQQQRDFLQQ